MHIPFINATFLESYLFLSMALSKFPKCLGFPDMTKGYHPYYFTDLSYCGKIVDLEYFDSSKMDEKEPKAFDQWYEEKSEYQYVFRIIYYYCKSDVDILRKGCIIFTDLMFSVANVLPFYDSSMLTIASAALKVFKQNFLRERQLALFPKQRYRGNVNQSLIALCWLRSIQHLTHSRISKNGEKKLCGRFVDKFDENSNLVYQFHGCCYHGCKKCFAREDFNTTVNETYHNLHQATKRF